MNLSTPGYILSLKKHELLQLPPNIGRPLTESEIRHILHTFLCTWKHSGDYTKPHASLPSTTSSNGCCTDFFINTPQALEVVNINRLLAFQLAQKIKEEYPEVNTNTIRVVNPSYSSTTLATNVANFINATKHTYLKKTPNGESQTWPDISYTSHDEVVLPLDEITASGVTGEGTLSVIGEANPGVRFAPIFPILINRSNGTKICGLKIVSIITFNPQEFNIWEPGQCPLCAAGSKPIRIRSHQKNNWQKLFA